MADQLLRSGFRFYQSANADAESIKEGFVIRQHEYEIIIEDIRRNPMEGSIQHYLLLGRRGSGKSTLLKRIQVEIETDKELHSRYIAINPAEEQANIYRLSDLWEEILQELEHADIEVSYPDWEEDAQSYSHKLAASVHEAIHKSGRKVILLLDNIDRIFENLKEDSSMLREYLLNFDDLKIIGGSTRMTEHFWKYDLPFYQFFRIVRLEPLSSDEVKKLLLYWSEKLGEEKLKEFVEKRTGQLETIRLLTDGLPRTLQFFVNILLTHGPETGYEYLRLIMDQVTPLYQERLNTLPPSQRKIVLQMAFLWESAGAREIAEVTHMDNKVISAQLKQLIDKGIADKIETDNKNHLYRLSERFFNLWLIFTQGSPNEKRKARCLTIFLENFYSPDELKQLVFAHLKRLKDGEWHPNKLALMTKAIAQSKYISSYERDELIEYTISLKNIDYELKQQLKLQTDEINKKILILIEREDWLKALQLANEIEQDDEKKWLILGYIYVKKKDVINAEIYYKKAAEKENPRALFSIGNLYRKQEKFDEAEKYYLRAFDKGYTKAINNLALLYYSQHKYSDAEKYYLLAVENGDEKALFNLGVFYYNQKRFEEAEKYYLMAAEKGNNEAIFDLGFLYNEMGRLEEAEKYYLLVFNKGNHDVLLNLGNVYRKQEKFEEAEKYYLLGANNGNVKAIFNLALLSYNLKKLEQAEKYYLLAADQGDEKALFNLGIFYYNQKRFEEAEKYYLLAVDKGDRDASYFLATLYEENGELEKAEKYYLIAIEKPDFTAMYRLSSLYYVQNKNKVEAYRLIYNSTLNSESGSREKIFRPIIDLWNGNIEGALLELKSLLHANISTEDINDQISYAMIHFLVHHQTNFILSLFEDQQIGKDLKERYKLIYYATSILARKDKNIELKIPPEIKQTVEDIVKQVKEMQNFYYKK